MRKRDDWIMTESGWRHRPWWKVGINSVLRAIQYRSDRPLLVATLTNNPSVYAGTPDATGYKLCRVPMNRGGVNAS
jgi:hypothetical protein